MSESPYLYLGLAASGLLFMGAQGLDDNQMEVRAIRPVPLRNIDVPGPGYIVVTSPGGEWIADRRDVMSVSCHTYEIEASTRVWEVTVSERSSNTVRFYYSQPMATTPVSAGTPSDESTGGKLDTLDGKSSAKPAGSSKPGEDTVLVVPVRKNYPESTHAHNIEYRVGSLSQLNDVYAYLTLMVYGWSPKMERPPEARKPRIHEVPPRWHDWDQSQTK